MAGTLKLFTLNADRAFGERVSQHLGIGLSEHEERPFEDGEHKTRALESVRDCDVYVVHSLYSDADQTVNDKLCRLLFFLGSLKDASAARLTAVIPYLCYARKDRKTKSRDPVTSRYVAGLLESVGVDRVVTLDAHNLAAFQNAFRCGTEHLEARVLFADHFASVLKDVDQISVVSPDVGGIKRAEAFRQALAARLQREPGSAFMEKQRSGGVVSGEAVVGDIEGRHAVIIDDLISSGTTIGRTVRACRSRGADSISAVASHGLFVGEAAQVVSDPELERLVVTDTIPPFRLPPELVEQKVTVLSAAALFAQAIGRMHEGGSLTELMRV